MLSWLVEKVTGMCSRYRGGRNPLSFRSRELHHHHDVKFCVLFYVRTSTLAQSSELIDCSWRHYSAHLTLYSPVVTICTASLTFNNSTFCPHTVFMCFVWIWEQTAIISLYSINWLVLIKHTEYVYCAVRAESLNTNRCTSLQSTSSVKPFSTMDQFRTVS